MNFVKEAVVFLDKLGMWDIVLPFIFVFTVVYAVLEKTKVLGKEEDGTPKHRFNAMASFVIGFFVLIAVDTLNIINRFSQWMVILILMGVCVAILFSFFGFKDIRKVKYGKFFMPIAFIIFGFVVLYAFGWLQLFDINTLRKYEGIIIGIIVFFIIMWIILREPKKTAPAVIGTAPAPPEEAVPKPGPKPAPEEGPSKEQQQKMLYNNILQRLNPELKERFRQEYESKPEEQKLPFLIDVGQQAGLLREQQ